MRNRYCGSMHTPDQVYIRESTVDTSVDNRNLEGVLRGFG